MFENNSQKTLVLGRQQSCHNIALVTAEFPPLVKNFVDIENFGFHKIWLIFQNLDFQGEILKFRNHATGDQFRRPKIWLEILLTKTSKFQKICETNSRFLNIRVNGFLLQF